MKGLLIKDFKLLKNQKNFLIIIVLIAVIMSVTMSNIGFVIGYLIMVLPFFSISTISYDEFDNGRAFLFTLPISRKLYIIEKYCFTFILGGFAMVLATIISLSIDAFGGFNELKNIFYSVPITFLLMSLFLSVFLPIQIKFGSEKSRYVLISIVAICVLIGYLGKKLFNVLNIDTVYLLNVISKIDIWFIVSASVLAIAIIVLLSLKISIAILNKKEF